MKRWIALAALALPLTIAGCSHPQPVYYEPPPPPPEFHQIAQAGFHDGWEAARRDAAARRPLIADRHQKFRQPPVPPGAFEEYRRGFRRGYENYVSRITPPR